MDDVLANFYLEMWSFAVVADLYDQYFKAMPKIGTIWNKEHINININIPFFIFLVVTINVYLAF